MKTYNSTALYLGSFDPIHQGHIKVLEHLVGVFLKVYIVPSPQNPFKPKQTPLWLRVEMIEEALKECGLEDKVDIYLGNISPEHYTYKQIGDLALKGYYIVGGTDIKEQIKTWKNADWILENFNTYFINRPGYSEETNENLVELSSNEIRNLIKENKSINELVPRSVEEIIYKKELYKT